MAQDKLPNGVLKVRVQPKASSNQILDYVNDTLRLRVTSVPEHGKANAAVIALLAKNLGIGKTKISILRGHTSRDKVLQVEAMTTGEIMRRLGIDEAERDTDSED